MRSTVLSTSCGPLTPSADTLIGTFEVRGTLRSNTCAPGLNPTTPATFTATLHVDREAATWSSGGASARGTASGSTFHVVRRTEVPVFTGCVLDQTETIDGTYALTTGDAGAPDAGASRSARVTGMQSVTISTRSGDACLDVLIVNGGSFPMIPCTAVTDLAGRTD